MAIDGIANFVLDPRRKKVPQIWDSVPPGGFHTWYAAFKNHHKLPLVLRRTND